MPDPAGLELIANELRERHPGSILDTQHYRGIATLVISPEQTLPVLGWLRDDPDQRYTFLASFHACDYLPDAPRFGLHYELLNMERVERIHVKALVDDPGEPSLPAVDSCIELYPSADFQEREAFDMFGIEFRGHPDLRRILMPDEYEGWPQRRDFPLGGETILFTHNEYEMPRWYE